MTRLADLNPRWLRAVADPLSQGYGVEFDCPCGNHDAPGCPRRIWLMFANPIGGPPARIGKQKWQRAGDSFDALTLEPSIHHVAVGALREAIAADHAVLSLFASRAGIPVPTFSTNP